MRKSVFDVGKVSREIKDFWQECSSPLMCGTHENHQSKNRSKKLPALNLETSTPGIFIIIIIIMSHPPTTAGSARIMTRNELQ